MPLFNSNLLNTMVTIKSTTINRASLAKPGIIEAIVISSSPLIPSANSTSKSVVNSYQVSLQFSNQVVDMVSPETIKAGSTVQLKINPDNTATILKVIDESNNSGKKSSEGLDNNTSTPTKTTAKTTAANPELLNAKHTSPLLTSRNQKSENITSQKTNNNQKTIAPQSTQKQSVTSIIDNGIRQSLPIQQSLKSLLPLLIQVTTKKNNDIPKPILNNLKTLLSNLPGQKQLSEPKTLKRTLLNSGSFLEAKLSKLLNEQQHRSVKRSKLTAEQLSKLPTPEHYQKREAAVINADSKAKTQQIIQQIEQLTGKTISIDKSHNAKIVVKDNGANAIDPALLQHMAMQTVKQQTTSHNLSSKNSDNIDIMLQQLGKQLLATLAKTQLNQLETLNQRNQSSTENSNIINSWTLETPIINGKNTDNLELCITEEELNSDGKEKVKQWKVMLDFDLHSLGKMSVELNIISKSVSATVWSEKERGHAAVKKEIDSLRNSLEKVGVNVKKVDCLLGIPEKSSPLIQQLVDIRT